MGIGNFPIAGKIVVVTGGGSGINLAFSQLAVQNGARVIIADLKLTADAESFVNEKGSKIVRFVKCDVTKRADLENLITVSESEYGDVPDVYVPGAGVFEPAWSNFWDDTEDDRYAEVDINITHPLKLSRIAIRALLRKNKKGVILITTSMAGFFGNLSTPLYSATKHAIVGLIRSLALLDDREGIKVVGVAPGIVKTPLWTDRPDLAHWAVGDDKRGTYILPEDVAKDMLSLVEDGKYVGGICLETSAKGQRVLDTWNIEAPSSSMTREGLEEVLRPTLAILKKERGV